MSMIVHLLAISQAELDELHKSSENTNEILYEKYLEERVDIDKAWDAIHFILTEQESEKESPLAHVIFGMRQIGEEYADYGPILATPATAVKEIAALVCEISEADFRAKFDPDALEEADIYPQIWYDETSEDYILSYFQEVQKFYKNAAENGQAVITYIS